MWMRALENALRYAPSSRIRPDAHLAGRLYCAHLVAQLVHIPAAARIHPLPTRNASVLEPVVIHQLTLFLCLSTIEAR
jgi:hypothetical protein